MQLSTEPPSSKGAMDSVQRLSRLHDKDNHGRNCNPHYMFRRGMCVEVRTWCDGPHEGDPRLATLAAPKGGWPYTEATTSGAAPTSPPEGVFLHKRRMELVELSGRTTGRLGYDYRLRHRSDGKAGTTILASTAASTSPPG